ncbi:MAG: hypothetical protein JNJ46_08645 [Myxococcales bacterium]|nr:hypothetical protein [Myxococcales bacterium]
MTTASSSPSSSSGMVNPYEDEVQEAKRQDKFTETEIEILFLLTLFGTTVWVGAAWIFAM